MPLPLNEKHIAERLHNYTYNNYLHIGSIIKGVTLGAATFVGLSIFSDINTNWPRVPLWIASFIAMTVSYMTWGRGVLLSNSRSNLWDSIFPLKMGMFEIALFGILQPKDESPQLWQHWFLLLSLHSLLAVFLITNRIKKTIIKEDFKPSLQDKLATECVMWMKADWIGALSVSIASIIIWFILNWFVFNKMDWFYPEIIQTILAITISGFLCVPIVNADKQRYRIEELI